MYSNFWYSLPYIYTNDLKSTMLLKLAYSDTLRIVVSEVTTYDDDQNDKYFVRRIPQWQKINESVLS